MLARVNRELGGTFDLKKFEHVAAYNAAERRVEMRLRARVAQTVEIAAAGVTVPFRAGETIWTESCHKFGAAEVAAMAARTGFRHVRQWVDEEWPFADSLWTAVG